MRATPPEVLIIEVKSVSVMLGASMVTNEDLVILHLNSVLKDLVTKIE